MELSTCTSRAPTLLSSLLVLRPCPEDGDGESLLSSGCSAIAGFILSFKKLKEHSNLETACYVGMGACILVAMKPLLDHLGELGATTAFWWLIGGGVSYIVGAVFYSLRKPYMHATFHLFCLGGSIGHIIAIWLIL